MPSFIQRSFAAGEIAPELGARADMIKYATGLKTCKNFIVQKFGGVANAPGTRFIAEVKNSNPARLVPFGEYVLEFTDAAMRAYLDGARVTGELTTPWNEIQLKRFQYARKGNTLTVADVADPPKDIQLSGSFFTIANTNVDPSISAPTTVSAISDGTPASPEDDTDSNYQYKVTAVLQDNAEESKATESTVLVKTGLLSPDNYITVGASRVANAEEYNVYRSENGSEFYFIGIMKQPDTGDPTLRDIGQEPDATVSPPKIRSYFDATTEYPGVVTFFQQRRLFARTVADVDKIWLSRTAAYNNFSISSPTKDDDAVIFSIAGRRSNRIQHAVNVGKLIILTDDGEWLVAGGGDGAVTPTSINVQQQGYSGASELMPVMVGNTALYVQAKGSVVRNLIYQFESDSYAGADLTVFANHLFRNHKIIDWAYQQTPDSIIWAVRDDGILLGLTYMPEHDIWGWHRHETDGFYESVTCVDEGGKDVIYFVVRRTDGLGNEKRFLERLEERIEDPVDGFYVHSGLSFDGRKMDKGNLSITNPNGYQVDLNLTILSVGNDYTFSDPDSIGDEIRTVVDGKEVRIRILSVNSSTSAIGESSIDLTGSSVINSNISPDDYNVALDTFSGLDHLNGKVVSVLADGFVAFDGNDKDDPRSGDFTVLNGTISLPNPAVVVHIGLPYQSDFQTLPLEIAEGETISNRRKIINKVGLLVESSRGYFAGEDFDSLKEFKQRRVSDGYGAQTLETDYLEMAINAKFNRPGNVCVRQTIPLPMSILSITATGTVGGN